MFDINVKDLSVEELKELEKKIVKLHVDVKKEILSRQSDFDMWYRYADKRRYNYVVDRSTLTRRFIMKHLDLDRYQTVTLDDMLMYLNSTLRDGKITKEEMDAVKQELMKLNFGSMEYDW